MRRIITSHLDFALISNVMAPALASISTNKRSFEDVHRQNSKRLGFHSTSAVFADIRRVRMRVGCCKRLKYCEPRQATPCEKSGSMMTSTRRGGRGGAVRRALIARLHDHDGSSGFCFPEFLSSIRDACGPRDSSGHTRRGVALEAAR
jgi:hypothetical protein